MVVVIYNLISSSLFHLINRSFLARKKTNKTRRSNSNNIYEKIFSFFSLKEKKRKKMTRFNNELSTTTSSTTTTTTTATATATKGKTTCSTANFSSSSSSSSSSPLMVDIDNNEKKPMVKLIGQPCGHHGSYTFYKAFSYRYRSDDQHERVLMLGEFFFIRISPSDDPCIGELQLVWDDHQNDQQLSSTRLYFLPEQTPDGRLSHHGQHEVMAANDKVILKLTDLVTWITHDVDWIAGSPYKWKPSIQQQQQQHDNEPSTKTKQILSPLAFIHNQNVIQRTNESSPFLTLQRYISSSCKIIFNKRNMNMNEYNIDTKSSSSSLSKANEHQNDLSTVVVLSYNRYCRYRNLLKRIEGREEEELFGHYIVQNLLTELGIPQQRNKCVHILFCRDTFNNEALLNNDLNCDHLAPKFKGRPKKRKHKIVQRPSSPESISSSEENGQRSFLPRRTRLDLYLFFTQAQKYGGYEKITKQRLWKKLYDDLGGDKRSTSAATCTRRHYEKLLLPFERQLNGLPDYHHLSKQQ
nr:AT-rich interactive domain-containing protein 5B-like [Dermatophagoides farinae]